MFTTQLRPSSSFLSSVRRSRRLPGEIKRASSALVKETREHHDTDELQPRQPLRDASTPTGSARIYVLGRRKEQEVDVGEALRALRAYSLTAIPETVEVNIKVDMTLKKDKVREPFKGPVTMAHTFGQERIVLFVSESTHHQTALEAGADIVAAEEIFSELEEDGVNFDICLTTPTMLDRFKPLQMKLKSKMPNIRRGTVVSEDSIAQAVQQFKTSREFRSDRIGHIHVPVGKLDFPNQHIEENISSVLGCVVNHRGNLPKSSFIQTVLLTTTYGPAFPIKIRTLL